MPTVYPNAVSKGDVQEFSIPSDVKKKSNSGPLTTFAVNPSGIKFETQEETERVILFIRQHVIVNVPWIVFTVLFLLDPPILLPLFFRVIQLPFSIPWQYYVVGTLFWYLATFGYAIASFISWFFNIYIVTNERLVDIDFYYLLYKDFKEAEHVKIQDLSYRTRGILATLFNYGNVQIETAGEAPNLTFELIPYPEKVVETIRALCGGGSGQL